MSKDISQIPLVYQDKDDTCIYCTITWIQQYIEQGLKLDCDYLVKRGKGSKNPLKILKKSKRINFIKDFETIGTSKSEIKEAIKQDPIMIGVDNYLDVGNHMMAGIDISEDGKSVKCVNWFNKNKQEITYIPFNEITFASKILRVKKPMKILDKIKQLPSEVKYIAGISVGVVLIASGLIASFKAPVEEYGSAGVVANYSTTLSGSGISASDTSIPVSSVTLYTGETFTSSDLTFPVYLMINPKKSTRELVECWGLTSLTWTSCGRGMSALGGNTTSTVSGAAFPHSSGETIIMTDAPYFFNRFVDRSSDQTIAGEKTISDSLFSFGDGTGQIVWNGTNMGWSDDDGSNTYTFVSGGSGLTASSTKGITITDSKILINASSTYGLAFDTGGKLYINASSTDSNNGGFLNFTNNQLYWDYAALVAKDNTWTGTNTFSTDPIKEDGSLIGMPPGVVMPYASTTAPTGWLVADGSAVSRATYADLFAIVGETYGAGDSSTTFNLPDMQGRTVHGYSTAYDGYDTFANTGGYATHTITIAEMPAHTHGAPVDNSGTGGSLRAAVNSNGLGTQKNTDSAGGDEAMDIRDPYIVMVYIIKY